MSCLQFDKHSIFCVTSTPCKSSCLKISFRIQLVAKPHSLCSLCPLWSVNFADPQTLLRGRSLRRQGLGADRPVVSGNFIAERLADFSAFCCLLNCIDGISVVFKSEMITPLFALSMPGWPEIVFILVIVLLLFGAKKLPELARGIGQSLGEFKRARDDFEREIHKSTAELEIKEPAEKQPHKPA